MQLAMTAALLAIAQLNSCQNCRHSQVGRTLRRRQTQLGKRCVTQCERILRRRQTLGKAGQGDAARETLRDTV